MVLLRRLSILLALSLSTACDESGGSSEDGDDDAGSTEDSGTAGDSGPAVDGNDAGADAGADAGPWLTSADLVGFYTANQPTGTPCYVTLFASTAVEIAAVDADTVTIDDGTSGTFTCDIVDDTLDCAPVSGTTPAVQIGPSTYCEWPYTVTATVTNVGPGGFHAQVLFATSPSPTTTQCGMTLGVCMGQGGAQFLRYVPAQGQPTAPPKSAVVKKNAI